jgi:hypothetical protein
MTAKVDIMIGLTDLKSVLFNPYFRIRYYLFLSYYYKILEKEKNLPLVHREMMSWSHNMHMEDLVILPLRHQLLLQEHHHHLQHQLLLLLHLLLLQHLHLQLLHLQLLHLPIPAVLEEEEEEEECCS